MARDTGFSPDVKRLILERSGGHCEAMLAVCTYSATEIHHRINRGMGGAEKSGTAEAALHLCSACHRHVTICPDLAYRMGITVHRNRVATAAEVPVVRRGKRVMLNAAGGVMES